MPDVSIVHVKLRARDDADASAHAALIASSREVMGMAGRNSKPKKDGPNSSPSRLDQFGDRLAEDTGSRPMKQAAPQSETCE